MKIVDIYEEPCEVKLPSIGDLMMKMPSCGQVYKEDELEPCTVVYVNKKHNYYMVEFRDTKIRECYKLVDIDPIELFKKDYFKAFGKMPKGIYAYESGMLYDSVEECAKDIGVPKHIVSRHLRGEISNVNGHHIYVL